MGRRRGDIGNDKATGDVVVSYIDDISAANHIYLKLLRLYLEGLNDGAGLVRDGEDSPIFPTADGSP